MKGTLSGIHFLISRVLEPFTIRYPAGSTTDNAFIRTILSNLKRKIIEKKVKQVYISLDRDAFQDSLKMVEEFMKNDIDVYFVNLPEKDPSDLGFEKVIPLLKETEKMKFSDLMRYKLKGKPKKSINI